MTKTTSTDPLHPNQRNSSTVDRNPSLPGLLALLVALGATGNACVPDVNVSKDDSEEAGSSGDGGVTSADDNDYDAENTDDAGSDSDDSDERSDGGADDSNDDDDATDDSDDDDATDDSDDDDATDDDDTTDDVSDDSGNMGDGGSPASGDEVEDTLTALNVDVTESPRVDGNGDPLPESYTPLRTRKTLRQKSELLLTGLPFQTEEDTVNLLEFARTDVDGSGQMAKLPTEPLPMEWQSSEVNAVTAGDIDGDGFDEMVFFWWDELDGELRVQTVDDTSGDFAASDVDTLGEASPVQLKIIAADFFGTGTDSLIIAVVEAEQITVTVLGGNAEDGYSKLGGQSLQFDATDAGDLGVELAAGQIDRDAAAELVVVTNETWGGGRNGSSGAGLSTYYVLDDAQAELEELASDVVSARVDNTTVDSLTSTVALGDVDGDSLDEILLAGLADSFPVDCEPINAVQLVLDDAAQDFDLLGAARSSVAISPGCESSGNNGWTNHLWAGFLNIDQDETRELHVNGIVYDDFANAAAWTPMELDGTPFEIPGNQVFRGSGGNSRPQIGRDSAQIVVGDVTDDGFDDIIVYTPTRERLGDEDTDGHHLRVWGFDPELGNWALKHSERLAGFPQASYSAREGGPVGLVALNVDNDSTVVQYTGTHRVIFTEPIVHAALAAPPCWDDGTQETDSCRTSWGQGASAGADASIAHEVSARKHMGWEGGVDIPFVGEIGVEFEETVGVSLSAEASLGYELTSTITYQTGAMEDTVVATVVPYDQYVYTLVSHSQFPELVGEEIVVSLPRRPRTIQIEREFYNRALGSSGTPIASNVFDHEIGDPNSYPSEGDARSATPLRVGPVEVGASTGNTDVELSETVTAGFRTSISVSYEATLKATSGAYMTGFSVGESLTASLGVTVGSTTTFSGSVGDIRPDAFTADKAYAYGMFVYMDSLADQDRPFQVINYWVE